MNGRQLKELLIISGINLNEREYIEDSKIYASKDIPDICIDINIFRDSIQKYYDKIIAEYIIAKLVSKNQTVINMKDIMNLFG